MIETPVELNAISGVYSLLCVATGKRYVGRSDEIGIRVMSHVYILRKNNHYNKKLQSDFNLYGESAFTYEILEESEPSILKEVEQSYIDRLGKSNLYNKHMSSETGAEAGEITEETRIKQSERQMGEKNHFFGKNHSPETVLRMKEARSRLPKFKCEHCEYEGLASSLAIHKKKH